MSTWSPARLLAPLALIGAVLAIYLVTRSELDLGSSASGTTSVASKRSTAAAAKKSSATRKRTKRKTYTVKKGDVLGSIARKTGVSISDLLDYNDVDAQSLSVGQKLKLRP